MGMHQAVRVALAKAQAGVDFIGKKGARCPVCGRMMPVVSSGPRAEGARQRYHKCKNDECVICALCLLVKSVEV